MVIISFRELRTRAKLTYQEVMSATGVDYDTVKGWDSGGKINMQQAKKIRDLAFPRCPCAITYTSWDPADCLFCVEPVNL